MDETSFGENSGWSKIEYDVDEDGRVYVLDRVENKVRIYDRQGNPQIEFGRWGQGPGEFDIPVSVCILGHDELMIEDVGSSSFKHYSKSGRYLRQTPLSRVNALIRSIAIAPNGDWVMLISPDFVTTDLIRYDHGLTISSLLFKTTTRPYTKNLVDLSEPEIEYAVDGKNNVIWGRTDKYELTVLDSKGRTVRKIVRERPRRPYPEYERKRWADAMQSNPWFRDPKLRIVYPKYEPAFDKVLADEAGRYFVLVFGPMEKNILNVFSHEGKPMGDAQIPRRMNHLIMKDGALYGIGYDDEGYSTIYRYRIVWKLPGERAD